MSDGGVRSGSGLLYLAAVVLSVAGGFDAAARNPQGTTGTTIHVFRQGLNGYTGTIDTHIRQSDPATSFGAAETLIWDTNDPPPTGADTFALLRFADIIGDNAGQIPPGAGIVSATLSYEVLSGTRHATMLEVLVDWDESTTYDTFGPAPGVQALDRASEITATAWVTGSAINLWDLNVRQSIVHWVDDPTANRGWIFQAVGTPSRVEFPAGEYTLDPTLRPTLTIVVNDTGSPMLVRRPFLQQPTTTTVKIVWRTDLASDSRVLRGPSPAELTTETLDARSVTNHVVIVTGLEPGQRYFYAIGSSSTVLAGGDETYFFETLPAPTQATEVTIWAMGDSGKGSTTQIVVRDAMLNALGGEAPDMMLHLGDLAYNYCTDGEISDHLLGVYEQTFRHTPLWPTVGNHEWFNNDVAAQTGPYYRTFELPANGESGGWPSQTESYYSFDYGTVHVVCLASIGVPVEPDSVMLQWVEADLAAANADWVIVSFVHGPYSKGPHDSDTDPWMTAMREVVLPVLELYGVDLVLSGHSHNYERTHLVDGAYDTPTTAEGHILDAGDGRADGDGAYCKSPGMNPHEGAVYVIAGHAAGGAFAGDHPLNAFKDPLHGSCLVRISGGELTVQNVVLGGAIVDHFTITKNLFADVDHDCSVGIVDFLLLLGDWGPCDDCAACPADLDGDCTVGILDFLALLSAWE